MIKFFILYNENLNLDFRESIASLIFKNLNQKYNISSSIFDINIKNFKQIENKKLLKELKFLSYDDFLVKDISQNIILSFKNNDIKIKDEILPYYKYLDTIFIKKDFDFTLISYFFALMFPYYLPGVICMVTMAGAFLIAFVGLLFGIVGFRTKRKIAGLGILLCIGTLIIILKIAGFLR